MSEIRHMWPRFDAGGEGSRGGKIVGHTSSGKPIYLDKHHPSHREFSAGEHHEAVDVHEKIIKPLMSKPVKKITKEENSTLVEHLGARKFHETSAKLKTPRKKVFTPQVPAPGTKPIVAGK